MNKQPKISVIICTHNPRRDYLQRVLQALSTQTLPLEAWELILIDNASEDQLSSSVDLSWHAHGRIIREDALGLTPARLRGISESLADLLVFCDDDNVFDPSYLEEALQISESWPTLGAWGGQLTPEFETEPAAWTKPYWYLIGSSSFTNDRWSNQYDPKAVPCGAGLCIRRHVVNHYQTAVSTDVTRKLLDRQGKSLLSAGDTDMALTACDMGLGTGLFASLKLRHLIPSKRFTLEYLLAMREAQTFSLTVLASFRTKELYRTSTLRLALDFARSFLMPAPASYFRRADIRGQVKARKYLKHSSNRPHMRQEIAALVPKAVGDNHR